MSGVIAGYTTLILVIATGWVLGRVGVIGPEGRDVISSLTFNAATPALFLTMLSTSDLLVIFSGHLVISIISVAVTCAVAVVIARLVWRHHWPDTVIAAFCACYVNAGNLGLPIAAYVLGDARLVVPMLLTQMLFLQPLGLAVLDVLLARRRGTRLSLRTVLTRPFRNPITVATLVGALMAVAGVRFPPLLEHPLTMLGNMAVPANLVAFGLALCFGPRPGVDTKNLEMAQLMGLKLVFQPLVAYALGRFVWHLDPAGLLAVVIIAALPTAQNVYINANRYRSGVVLARDQVFMSTVASVPVLLVISALLPA